MMRTVLIAVEEANDSRLQGVFCAEDAGFKGIYVNRQCLILQIDSSLVVVTFLL